MKDRPRVQDFDWTLRAHHADHAHACNRLPHAKPDRRRGEDDEPDPCEFTPIDVVFRARGRLRLPWRPSYFKYERMMSTRSCAALPSSDVARAPRKA